MDVKLDLSASKCFNDMGPQGCRPREGGYRGVQNEEGERGGTIFSHSSHLGRQGVLWTFLYMVSTVESVNF